MTKLRWGILGCAKIAIRACIPGIQQSETGVVSAIASRNLQKSQETAEQLGIPKAYGSYEELIADPDIDALYIPLPNHLHKEWTIRAAEAGKHVLCEKPAALTAAEAEEMVAACEKAGVQFAEAFMYRHHPRFERIKQIIDSGEIGDIRGIHGAFTFSNPGDKTNVRYKREWGGGSLYDVGCYPISAARMILGREPEAVTTHAFFSPEHDDVDMMMSGLVEFSGNVALTFDCGMWAGFRNTLEIVGATGRIEVPSAFVTPTEESGHFIVHAGGERRVENAPFLNQYSLEVDDLAYAAWGKKAPNYAAGDAILNMKVLDACLQSARERSRIVL
ncbi:Gfo/Idh/MocA family protein [Paenibacillus sp. GCM10023248]|uniref:Gfo/Idh/MocA family protein n=1 Tax=Bacillales TaxID=1385 RepID=UPI00237998BE|nr:MULTISPECIES: Gfo/Idh/MocA family oxidoreductase [Bacillales]MDD9269758.1 Gfo/Idh/MocA family oxidoreductase [Paenibacillus sp. MAHUQ-63]MDR6881830.1 putative dehydrogenase [Bacillus sp. 3255]